MPSLAPEPLDASFDKEMLRSSCCSLVLSESTRSCNRPVAMFFLCCCDYSQCHTIILLTNQKASHNRRDVFYLSPTQEGRIVAASPCTSSSANCGSVLLNGS